jgi:poly-gamma-glutamate capsule biosynthesis protein CapA/YwtB (metallophosphatase superfamily)
MGFYSLEAIRRRKRKITMGVLSGVFVLGVISLSTYQFMAYLKDKKSLKSSSETNSVLGESTTTPAPTPTPAPTTTPSPVTASGTVRVIATGEFIAHDVTNARAKKADGTYDYLQFIKNLQTPFATADVRVCDQDGPSGGDALGISGYPTYNAPTQLVTDLATLGCNVVNLATNHMNDKGQAAIDATLAAWDKTTGISVNGANRTAEEQQKQRVFTAKGVKFAHLSYTTFSEKKPASDFSVNVFDQAKAQAEIAAVRKDVDIVMVSICWGSEDAKAISADQDTKAQFFADNGVDIVLGECAHSILPVKVLKQPSGKSTVVWYSLGNALNAQLPTEYLFGGLAVIDIDAATKTVKTNSFLPTYMHYEWTAAEKASSNFLARKNLALYLLDDAADPLSRSLLGTSVGAQKDRLLKIVNQFTTIPLISMKDLQS